MGLNTLITDTQAIHAKPGLTGLGKAGIRCDVIYVGY